MSRNAMYIVMKKEIRGGVVQFEENKNALGACRREMSHIHQKKRGQAPKNIHHLKPFPFFGR